MLCIRIFVLICTKLWSNPHPPRGEDIYHHRTISIEVLFLCRFMWFIAYYFAERCKKWYKALTAHKKVVSLHRISKNPVTHNP